MSCGRATRSILSGVAFVLFCFLKVVHAEPQIESQDVLVFLFLSIIIGAVVTYLLSRFAPDLPYTVVLFIIGCIVGVSLGNENDHFSISSRMWDSIDPKLLLFVFLPALLFGDAMSLSYHHVKGAINQALLLAGPGSVFGTFATAGLAKVWLPYRWNWTLCFLFGAVLCATDPVGKYSFAKNLFITSPSYF